MNSVASAILDDAQIVAEASRQVGRQVAIRKVHLSLVRPADTVFHEGKAQTVCPGDLKNDAFMGRTLFGDSYVLGHKPVMQIIMQPASPAS